VTSPTYTLQDPNTQTGELEACVAFLQWQGLPCQTFCTTQALKHSKGVRRPVLLDRKGKPVAVGFFEIVKWITGQGLVHC